MSNVSRGQLKERVRIKYYKSMGMTLLQRAVRTMAGGGDLGGMWDAWFWNDLEFEWMFVQIGPHSKKKAKLRECHAWLKKYGIFVPGVVYRLDLYKKKRGKIEWESVML